MMLKILIPQRLYILSDGERLDNETETYLRSVFAVETRALSVEQHGVLTPESW